MRLKGIAGLLDEAVKKKTSPIEISGKVFDIRQAAEVGKTLRVGNVPYRNGP